MSRLSVVPAVVMVSLAGWMGCVSVETPDAKVHVGITQVNLPGSEPADPNATPYAHSLRKVSRRQGKVAEKMNEGDWKDVVEESGEWMDDIRGLAGYAGESHEPRLFRQCCDQLMQQVGTLQQAAMRRDVARAQQAFDACNPPLNRLVETFPLTRQASQAAVGSPPPYRPPSAQPSSGPKSTPQVP